MTKKNILKSFVLAGFAVLACTGIAHAVAPVGNACALIESMKGVFATLKILAAAGAVFCIAGWAWTYITDPGKATKDDMKDKGVGLLVGFTILFGITLVLQFLPQVSGCPNLYSGW